MSRQNVAFLGPNGTYSHLVAEKFFGRYVTAHPLPTILDVCEYVSRGRDRVGVVPIENSSGGAIYETVDILLAGKPRLHISEEVSLEVNLALLGTPGEHIRVLYSHFAPLEHCSSWIRKSLPRVRKEVTTSTAAAAGMASEEEGAAALGSRKLGGLYGLSVLHYPVEADVPNITTFLCIGGRDAQPRSQPNKTTLSVRLANVPGSLCTFLEVFRSANVNLSRLISRPVRGCHREYAFLVDLQGGAQRPVIREALAAARKVSTELRVVGSYPSRRRYKS